MKPYVIVSKKCEMMLRLTNQVLPKAICPNIVKPVLSGRSKIDITKIGKI